jgi:hypothetical protein
MDLYPVFIHPNSVTVDACVYLPPSMVKKVRKSFLACICSDNGPQIKTKLEVISLMVKNAGMTLRKVRQWLVNKEWNKTLAYEIDILNYLTKNYSYNEVNGSIDLDSLFRVFSEIVSFLKSDSLDYPYLHKRLLFSGII